MGSQWMAVQAVGIYYKTLNERYYFCVRKLATHENQGEDLGKVLLHALLFQICVLANSYFKCGFSLSN